MLRLASFVWVRSAGVRPTGPWTRRSRYHQHLRPTCVYTPGLTQTATFCHEPNYRGQDQKYGGEYAGKRRRSRPMRSGRNTTGPDHDSLAKRLTNRVVDSEQVREEEALLEEVLTDLPEEDTFGTLGSPLEKNTSGLDRVTHGEEYDPDLPEFWKNSHHVKGTSPNFPVEGQEKSRRRSTKGKGDSDSAAAWAEEFGTLAGPGQLRLPADVSQPERQKYLSDDEDDDHIPLRERGLTGHTVWWYSRQIERLGKAGKVYEAIQMLEDQMIKQDRVRPNEFLFTLLIGILGRAGYTKKAFGLFKKMRNYGLVPSEPTYTALFNACANSPWKEDGLRRATRLRQAMTARDVRPNAITTKAMVKAYGRHGDLRTAFAIMDEMTASGFQMDEEGWSHLLMACISDKEAGFKHCIEVWRVMRRKGTIPDTYLYNLLLRAARDCGVGDREFANQLIGGAMDGQKLTPGGSTSNRALSGGELKLTDGGELKLADAGNVKKTVAERKIAALQTIETSSSGISILDLDVPNMLNPRGRWRRHVVTLGDLSTAGARLALLGGLPGILGHMVKDRAEPDIKTFTQLMDMLPANRQGEGDLLHAMTTHNVRPDTDFINLLIRRRCKRADMEGAKDMLGLMGHLQIQPNILTFACLATGCYGYKTGLQLLRDIETAELRPTVEIYGILLRRSAVDFAYKLAICASMKKQIVDPDERVLRALESDIAKARAAVVRLEQGKSVDKAYMKSTFKDELKRFLCFYKPWLLEAGVDLPDHPWAQYRRPSAMAGSGADPHQAAPSDPKQKSHTTAQLTETDS